MAWKPQRSPLSSTFEMQSSRIESSQISIAEATPFVTICQDFLIFLGSSQQVSLMNLPCGSPIFRFSRGATCLCLMRFFEDLLGLFQFMFRETCAESAC